MALVHCNFYSDALGVATAMDVILPERREAGPCPAQGRPSLLLLHGLSDDHTVWQRRTSIERYAAPLGLAVVMPGVNRSFYADMHSGYRYWTFVSEELPAIVRDLFPISARREDSFVAGLSMGGYGAFKLALRCPDRFAAAASLSGSLDIAAYQAKVAAGDATRATDQHLIFGPASVVGGENDLMACASRLAGAGSVAPALYQWCGTEDFLYQGNLKFRDHARRLALPLTYEESAGGHEWACWDRQIQRVLEWIPLNRQCAVPQMPVQQP